MLEHPFSVTRPQAAFVFPEKNATLLPFLGANCRATIVPSVPRLVTSQKVFLRKRDKINGGISVPLEAPPLGSVPLTLYTAVVSFPGWQQPEVPVF